MIDGVCRLAEERAAAGAAAGRLDGAVVAALGEAGLFKLYLPASLGGLGLDLVDATDTIARLAEADPAAGWAVMIGAGPNWFADHMPTPLVEEVFGPPDSCVAGSGKVGAAEPDGDGWRVRGRWRWCSGAPWATWFTFNAAAADPVAPFTFAVPAAAVSLHADTWDVRGLRATASWDVELADVHVPRHRTFQVAGAPTGRTTVSGVSFPAFARATMAAVSVGATRRALRLFGELAARKASSFPRPDGSVVVLARDPLVADRVARAEAAARAAAGYLRQATQAAVAGDDTDLALAAPHAATTGAGVARTLWDLSGMTVLADGDPLGRALADVQAAAQNAVVAPARFAEAGVALLGGRPEGPRAEASSPLSGS